MIMMMIMVVALVVMLLMMVMMMRMMMMMMMKMMVVMMVMVMVMVIKMIMMMVMAMMMVVMVMVMCRSVGSYDHGIRIFYTTSEGLIWGYLESLMFSNDFWLPNFPSHLAPLLQTAAGQRGEPKQWGIGPSNAQTAATEPFGRDFAGNKRAPPPHRVEGAHTRVEITV